MTDIVRLDVLGVGVDACTWETAIEKIGSLSRRKVSSYVCITNVHSVVTGRESVDFRKVLGEAVLVTPDGAPVAWLMRRLGVERQGRINGPDLMLRYCAVAASRSESIFLYGSSTETLALLKDKLKGLFPNLEIAGAISPPFRTLSDQEDQEIVDAINRSGAGTVWVSLGCPKQEIWMAAHKGSINAVMIGVGAAFDYHAGTIGRAPIWMRDFGLEWLHRLLSEPRRLWRRYLHTNSAFVLAVVQLFLRRLISGKGRV